MKKITFLLFSISILFFVSCNKSENVDVNEYVGTWEGTTELHVNTKNYSSLGAPAVDTTLSLNQAIEIKPAAEANKLSLTIMQDNYPVKTIEATLSNDSFKYNDVIKIPLDNFNLNLNVICTGKIEANKMNITGTISYTIAQIGDISGKYIKKQ